MCRKVLPALCALVCLAPLSLVAQQTKAPPERPVTGLKVLSTTIDPQGREVTVRVQNTTNRTAVAWAFSFHQFDATGTDTTPEGYGVDIDHAGPNALPHDTGMWIKPGQIGSIQLTAANPGTVSVTATVAGVVYEDLTAEGRAARLFVNSRAKSAQEAREAAAKEPSAEKKAELERKAAWFEAHSPVEAQQ